MSLEDSSRYDSISIRPESFESQFDIRQTIPGYKLGVVDVAPPSEILKDEVPVLLVPGWSENPSTYKKTLEEIYKGQRRAVTLDFDKDRTSQNNDIAYPQVELSKADQILGVIAAKGIERVDAIFHSEGAINGLLAAIQRPDLFRNIVIDKGAGLIGEDGKPNLIGRFVKLAAREFLPRSKKSSTDTNNGLYSTGRVLNYLATNPLGVLSELDALTSTDIIDLIHGLEGKGVMISVVSGVDDPLFPTDRQVEHLRKSQGKSGKTLPIEGFVTVVGGHNELSLNEEKHTALALNLLTNMQRRRESGRHAVSAEAELDLEYVSPLQTFETSNGKLTFRDVMPENPRENGGDVPLVTMVGWAMNQQVMGNTLKGLVYDHGQRIIPVDFAGAGKGVKVEGSNSSEINRQAEILREWIEGRPEPKLNFMGQSMATITLLALVENHPEIAERIDKVLLVSPMGISSKDGVWDLMQRKSKEDKRNSLRKKNYEDHQIEPVVDKAWKGHVSHHPIRSMNEILALANAHEYDVLELLKSKGIKVGVITSAADKLADIDRLSAQISEGYESPFKPLSEDNGVPGMKFRYQPSDKPTPPIDYLRIVDVGNEVDGRGHGITGPRKLAGTIMRTLMNLDHPLTLEQVLANQADFRKSDSKNHSDKPEV